jgi:branched-subunit amino acid aminotransferase/4-amino-4-deoxychorismate lyase
VSGVVIFETMRVRGGALPLLDAHVARLRCGAQVVGLPAVPDDVPDEAAERARTGADRILRPAWSASGARWSERLLDEPAAWRARTVAEPHPGYPVKTEDRAAFDRALAAARAAGADEPLLSTPTGTVVEGARFAVVWVDGDDLCFPDPDLGGLPSVGLARLLTVAEAARVGTRAAWVAAPALLGRPVGLVNAVRGLVRVEALDDRPVPSSDLLESLAAGFWPSA